MRMHPNAVACIDDHSKVVMDFANNGKIGIVVDANWNKDASQEGVVGGGSVIRLRNWESIEGYLLGDLILLNRP